MSKPQGKSVETASQSDVGGWVEDSWSFPQEDGHRQRSTRGRSPLEDDEEEELEAHTADPWAEFLSADSDEAAVSGVLRDGSRDPRNGVSDASLPLDSPLRNGWTSLVQLGQQLVRQHEGQGREVVRSLFGGLNSRNDRQGASPPLRRHSSPPTVGGSSTLSQPLLGSVDEGAPEESLASGLEAEQQPQRQQQRSISGGSSSTWQSATGLLGSFGIPGSGQQGRPSTSSSRQTRDGDLVVPLKSQTPGSRSSQSLDGSVHGGGEGGGRGRASFLTDDGDEDHEDAMAREEMLRIGRPLRRRWGWGDGGAPGRHTCVQKVLEVLPVLGVVTLLALGTVTYFTIVDRVLAAFRSPFSLSCKVEVGAWVPRGSHSLSFAFYTPSTSITTNSSRVTAKGVPDASPYYPPSCPYIRDEFNCAKFGLPEMPDGDTWQPDSCQLPPVKPVMLLQALRNRSVAFVGDMTVANQFDSFVCQLAQQEQPVLRAGSSLSTGDRGRANRGLFEQEGEQGNRVAGANGRPESSLRGLALVGSSGRRRRGLTESPKGKMGTVVHTARAGEDGPGLWDFWPFSEDLKKSDRGKSGVDGQDSTSDSTVVTDVTTDEDAALGVAPGEGSTGTGKGKSAARPKTTVYRFPVHNVTVGFYHSPFLVKTDVTRQANASACQRSKAVLLEFEAKERSTPAAPLTLPSPTPSPAPPLNDTTTPATPPRALSSPAVAEASLRLAVRRQCYPNTIDLAIPDPLWATEAAEYDVILLSSGRGWTEEAAERGGLGVVEGGQDKAGVSLEGLQGEWGYPRAMGAVARWLDNSMQFPGTAVFRSYSPGHDRRQCASRSRLASSSETFENDYKERFERYNDALAAAIDNTRHLFLNITSLSWERGDGHPWMASPARPKADCGNWCLPGVPDTWNHILGRMILEILKEKEEI